VAALVLGIVGLVLVSTCWGSVLAVIVSPIALGLGLSARRAVDRGEMGGRGQATAGFVMGIIGLVLSLLTIAAFVLAFALGDGDLGPSPADPYTYDTRGTPSAAVAEPV
jgi:hypothetical protein